MRFLTLTGFQALLLGLVTSGILIALYFLKLRHRRMVVASSMLWSRVLDERVARSLWERFRKLISIVVTVAAGLLLALAIGRPELSALTGTPRRILLVLDTSPTMLARTSDGRTRWQHAVTAARGQFDANPPSTEFRVADTSGLVDSGFTSNRRALRDSLERMRPAPGQRRLPAEDDQETRTVVVSDGVSPGVVPPGTGSISVYQAAENVGITAFEIRSTPSSPLAYEAYLEVFNYGKSPAKTAVAISGPGRQRISRDIDLQPGESLKEPFDLSLFEGGAIRASVQSVGDAYPLDDVAYAYLPVERRTRTLLVTPGNNYLETLLKLDTLVNLTIASPAAYDPGADVDVFIFDGFVPPAAPPRPALIVNRGQQAGWLPAANGVVPAPKFASWAEEHPAMKYVSLHDVSIERAWRLDRSDFEVLAETEDRTPLILASPASRKPRWVMLAFNIQASDFPIHAGFPLFVDNVLGWFSREPLALRRQPGTIDVPVSGAAIKGLDGKVVPVKQRQDGVSFDSAEPGLYLAASEDTRQYVAVNLASREYSNINKTAFDKQKTASAATPWAGEELWFYMLSAALVLIGAEWFTYHRSITL